MNPLGSYSTVVATNAVREHCSLSSKNSEENAVDIEELDLFISDGRVTGCAYQ